MIKGMGERLAGCRAISGLTQKQVAERVGVSVSSIALYEADIRRPKLKVLMRLALLYGCTVDYLVLGKPMETPVKDITDSENFF